MVFRVTEQLTIANVVEEKGRLMTALALGEDIAIDGREVHEVDVAGLQLLLATKREVETRGKAFKFLTSMCSQPLTQALAVAALTDALVTTDTGREPTHG